MTGEFALYLQRGRFEKGPAGRPDGLIQRPPQRNRAHWNSVIGVLEQNSKSGTA